jgi:hypothetical protein
VPSALGIWGLTSAGKGRGARLLRRWDIPLLSPQVCVRAVKPLQFPRPASSASDTDDEDDDKEDEDEGPRPYGIAGKPL